MNRRERFKVYHHNYIYKGTLHGVKKYIVLAHDDGTMTFTDFHRYLGNPNRKIKPENENGNNRAAFVCEFLNYAFFTAGISSLSELTVEIGRSFLTAYGMHELPDDNEDVHRNKTTIQRCASTILDFYINLIDDPFSGAKIKAEDLYKTITVRDKHGKAIQKNIPKFEVRHHFAFKRC